MQKNLSFAGNINCFEDLTFACNHFGIELNNNQLDLFKQYYKTLLEWNEKINLISRKGYDSVLEKHFLDSILFLPEIDDLMRRRSLQTSPSSLETSPTAVLDIGSGGGFPGIPLAIMKPEWKFTLCESTTKKANFLNHLVKELGLNNVKVINDRIENVRAHLAKGEARSLCERHGMPQQYNLITARAIAKLDELIKYAIPLLKKEGYLLAYKAKDIDEEIKHSKKIIEKNKLELQIFSKEMNGTTRKLITIRHCEEARSADAAIS